MSEHDHQHHHPPAGVRRHVDVAIVGGSVAGLGAALQLGRQRRSVAVVDSGSPRNAPAEHLHGYLGHDGEAPDALLAAAREEVRSYGGEVLAGTGERVVRDHDGFTLELAGGHTLVARRVVLATGIVDVLPDIDGVAEHWGTDVVHCPFCHGYEVRDRRLVHVVTHGAGLHVAVLFRQLTDRLTVVLHDGIDPDLPQARALREAGVPVRTGGVRRIVSGGRGEVVGVELEGGEVLPADAVVVGTTFRPRVDAVQGLDPEVADHPSGLGRVLVTGPDGATSVPGLYAAGNVVDPSQQLLQAAASGSWVGAMVASDLATEDLGRGARTSANQQDWEHRYDVAAMWSGNPNGTLVHEMAGSPPGRALDVGAGEGGDAVWLAERGWSVTAVDISSRALARLSDEAGRRSLPIESRVADANGPAPFGSATFDLVIAMYASIPRTPDDRAVRSLMDAVAPGGTLLVVGHDLAPMRAPIDTSTTTRAFDPDAYVRVDDVARCLQGRAGWKVEVHGLRPRPSGAVSSHHVNDVVLGVRRLAG